MPNNDITVLMATHNGAAYLREQLDSIAAQTHRPARLVISDDGSKDETRQIIQDFADYARFPVLVVNGPQQGVSQNMLSLLHHTSNDLVAFADQDDVWFPSKLERAVTELSKLPKNQPALYTAQRIFTNQSLIPFGVSQKHRFAPVFANALVQNIAPGNTIVLNVTALALAQSATSEALNGALPFHDWWLYQLITGAGGAVVFDPTPVLYYRQHPQNYFGAGVGFSGRISRLKALFDGSYKHMVTQQAVALGRSWHRLDAPAQWQLDQFLDALEHKQLPLRRLGLYRQSRSEQFLLRTASQLNCL